MGDHYDKHREADYDSMRVCDACMSKENVFQIGGGHICAKCQEEANRMQQRQDNRTYQDYKADAGKVRLSTVPASLERAVAEIRNVGIAKYGDNERWREVSVERYFDAMLRHVNSMREHGLQAVDDESGCKHLHHVACNVAFLVELLGNDV